MTVTSTVCLIAKNEGPYLLEWIAYYRVLGFDNIVVYENNSDDDSDAILRSLAKAKKIIHRTWKLGRNESPQITAYRDALRMAKTDWILFVDADEFLVLHKHENVNDFLASFEDDVSSIGVNWRIFGDSGHQQRDDRPVMERFTKAAEVDFGVNQHLKSFSRVKRIGKLVHMHVCETKDRQVHASGQVLTMPDWGISDKVEFDVAQVNHYYTKTLEEYQIKKRRGQGGAGDNNPEVKYWYNDESFHMHNRNDVEDLNILRIYDKVQSEMSELKMLVKQ